MWRHQRRRWLSIKHQRQRQRIGGGMANASRRGRGVTSGEGVRRRQNVGGWKGRRVACQGGATSAAHVHLLHSRCPTSDARTVKNSLSPGIFYACVLSSRVLQKRVVWRFAWWVCAAGAFFSATHIMARRGSSRNSTSWGWTSARWRTNSVAPGREPYSCLLLYHDA